MSFGTSLSDAVLLTQLAYKVVQNTRQACGEHAELTQQVTSLQLTLKRLEKEIARSEKAIDADGTRNESYKEEFASNIAGCELVLSTLNKILEKYNAIGSDDASKPKRLWQEVRFGNGEVAKLSDLRAKVVYHSALLTLLLNLSTSSSIGRVEQQMNAAGGDLKEIKAIVNGIAAVQVAQDSEKSVFSRYSDNDDKAAWRELRRELRLARGFRDSDLRRYKPVILAYLTELGDRGALDEQEPTQASSLVNHKAAGLAVVDMIDGTPQDLSPSELEDESTHSAPHQQSVRDLEELFSSPSPHFVATTSLGFLDPKVQRIYGCIGFTDNPRRPEMLQEKDISEHRSCCKVDLIRRAHPKCGHTTLSLVLPKTRWDWCLECLVQFCSSVTEEDSNAIVWPERDAHDEILCVRVRKEGCSRCSKAEGEWYLYGLFLGPSRLYLRCTSCAAPKILPLDFDP